MRRLYKYVALPRHDRCVLRQATFLLVLVWSGLRLLSFQRLCRLIARVPPKPTSRVSEEPPDILAALRAIDIASRVVPGATCLTRALALQVLLRRQGRVSRLHIGVAKDQAHGLEAHAWVEYRGRIVLGDSPDLSRYTRLPLPDKTNFSCMEMREDKSYYDMYNRLV